MFEYEQDHLRMQIPKIELRPINQRGTAGVESRTGSMRYVRERDIYVLMH